MHVSYRVSQAQIQIIRLAQRASRPGSFAMGQGHALPWTKNSLWGVATLFRLHVGRVLNPDVFQVSLVSHPSPLRPPHRVSP